MESCRLYTKFATRPASLEAIPLCVSKAIKAAINGRPGVAYIDLPGDMLRSQMTEQENIIPIQQHLPTISIPLQSKVKEAMDVLAKAERPLVIVGKGAAYSPGASALLKAFINRTNLPFLSTPMGKGCVPDDDIHSVAPARYLKITFS